MLIGISIWNLCAKWPTLEPILVRWPSLKSKYDPQAGDGIALGVIALNVIKLYVFVTKLICLVNASNNQN